MNSTTPPLEAPVPVAVAGGGRVALVTGVGNGAVADDRTTGVTEAGVDAAAAVVEVAVVDGVGATGVEEGKTRAAELVETPAATV